MRLITALGYYWIVLPLLAVAILVLCRRGLKLSAALLLVSTSGGVLLTSVLKAVFQRARPELFNSGYTASFYSFPSGHATVAVGFYGMLTLILAYRLGRPWRWIAAAGGTSLVLLIGFSRLYLGVHYLTDVLVGYLSAALWVSTVGTALLLLRSFSKKPGDRTSPGRDHARRRATGDRRSGEPEERVPGRVPRRSGRTHHRRRTWKFGSRGGSVPACSKPSCNRSYTSSPGPSATTGSSPSSG